MSRTLRYTRKKFAVRTLRVLVTAKNTDYLIEMATLMSLNNPLNASNRPQPLATNSEGPGGGPSGPGQGEGGSGAGGGSSDGGGGGFRGRKVTTCSFCGKTSREVGPMVEGPSDVYICGQFTELCLNIFMQ